MSINDRGFVFIELLAVVVIIGVMVVMLVPAIQFSRQLASRATCASNLKQLHMANMLYSQEHGTYVPASSDFLDRNLIRWHGVRKSTSQEFQSRLGPLAEYLDSSGEVRRCPSMPIHRVSSSKNGFEAACGGYGYNSVGVGSQVYLKGFTAEAFKIGMYPTQIEDPSRTAMFADCAYPQPYGKNPQYLIEYSFMEPYYWVFTPGIVSGMRADPSIHFRHRKRANIVWCDGHVSTEKMGPSGDSQFKKMNIGWFGIANNALIDPY